MKTTKHTFLLAVMALLLSTAGLQAQDYNLAAGARLGYPLSLSVKKSIGEGNAVEGILGYRGFVGYNWINVGAAYQRHTPIPDVVDGLNWYWGVGASVFLFNYDLGFGSDFNSTAFGVQGYLGLDYTFADAPINLTLDWVPTLFLGNDFVNGFGGGYGGIGVRYVIGQN